MLTVAAYSKDPLAPLDRLLRFAKDVGLSHVQLAWEQIVRTRSTGMGFRNQRAADFGPRDPSMSDLAADSRVAGVKVVFKRLRREGLEPVGLDATALDCMDEETFAKQIEDIDVQMQTAERLGVGHVTIAAGPRDPSNFDHVVDGFRRLAVSVSRLGVGMSIRNLCDSSVEQLDDLHRLFREVGVESLTLDLDMAEFQTAAVNPHDAAVSFPGRIARVRTCDVNLEATLAALRRDGFTGAVLAAVEDGVPWSHKLIAIVRRS